jgi:hypothetical protein
MVRGKERESSTDCIWEDTVAPFESCRSTDTNLLLTTVTKWEDMGCTPGTTLEYSLLLQMYETQTQSVSLGLCPILLLALLASLTSAYTSLGVSQDSNPQLGGATIKNYLVNRVNPYFYPKPELWSCRLTSFSFLGK